jgi:type I restriction enzyme R subunit
MFDLPPEADPTDEQLKKAAAPLKQAAIQTLMTTPALRTLIVELRDKFEQVVDEVSKDELIEGGTGYSQEAKDKAAALVKSFEEYLAEHKDEIDALQYFYAVPHKNRLKYKDIKALADAISSPPRQWTPEKLWHAYETLEKSKVRGASAGRLLTDVVSLVRFALHQEKELAPHAERVRDRFENWMAQQANQGRAFSDDQRRWLEMMRDHIATSVEVEIDDFDLTPFTGEGGLAKATKLFGKDLASVVRELNEALVA